MDNEEFTYNLINKADEDSDKDREAYDVKLMNEGNPLATSDSTVTWLASLFNLTSTILGSGVLALPYAFSRTGYVLGTILIVLSALSSMFSLHLLALCGVKAGIPASFYSVTDASVPRLTFLVDVSVITLCLGTAISYLIVIGGLMPQVMDSFGGNKFSKSRELWILIGFCIVMPLCCPRKLEALRFTSALCVCFVCLLAVLVFLYSVDIPGLDPCADIDPVEDGECVGDRVNYYFTIDTLRVFAIFIFAFSCQTNIFCVTNELRKPSFRRYRTVMFGAVGLTTSLYTIVAICGYYTYGYNVLPNVLENYPLTTLTSMTRIMVCVLVAFTFPLNCQPARTSTLALWHAFFDEKGDEISESVETFRYWAVTIGFVAIVVGCALLTSDFGVVLGLVGATGATIVQYILPGLSYLVLYKDEGPAWKRHMSLILVIAGFIIMPVCCVFIFV